MDGFLILDKPVGPSSAGLLNRVKRLLPRGTKLGHAGTLDPLASGVLVALVGRATKRSDAVMGQAKRYVATVALGATSATDDAEGPITPWRREGEAPAEPSSVPQRSVRQEPYPPEAVVRDVVARFVGTIEQLPPAFSAVKIAGRRACDRVRDGQTVELKSRLVRVDAIDVLAYAWPTLELSIDCGKGTYVRSIARDVGAALGVGGYLSALRRTRVGDFDVERAATPEALERDGAERWLLPVDDARAVSR